MRHRRKHFYKKKTWNDTRDEGLRKESLRNNSSRKKSGQSEGSVSENRMTSGDTH